jgi:CTP synthase
VIRALQHAAIEANRKLFLDWIDATDLEPNTQSTSPDSHKKVSIAVVLLLLVVAVG